MPVTFTTTNQQPERVRADLLAVPVLSKRELGAGSEVLGRTLATDAGARRELVAFMKESGFDGEPGQALLVPTVKGLDAKSVLLVGVGARNKIDADVVRRAAAEIARRASLARTVVTTLLDAVPGSLDAGAAAQALAEGVALGSYRYLEYKSDGEPNALRKVVVSGDAAVKAGLERGRVIAQAVIWARDMVNEPAGAKPPTAFAAAARKLLSSRGVTVTVLTEAQMKTQRMGGVLGVGQGSSNPPRFVKAVYDPPGARANGTLALVGKGVVFDSGGLSIKPASGMETMKTDMSGAAAVLGAMSTLEALGVKRRIVAYTPMVENMPSGTAIRPGDVLKIRNGTTVEVLNTDAEGRLILADALALAVDDGADAIVDLATLTGACVVALGEKVAGVMGNDDGWIGQVQGAADRTSEALWALPLPKEYRKMLESEVADLRNIGTSSYGGALTAGLFLQAFVGDVPWAHMDIAGPARAGSDDGYMVKGGTGYGVRTLVELAESWERPAKKSTKKPAKKSVKKTAKRTAKKTAKKVAKRRA